MSIYDYERGGTNNGFANVHGNNTCTTDNSRTVHIHIHISESKIGGFLNGIFGRRLSKPEDLAGILGQCIQGSDDRRDADGRPECIAAEGNFGPDTLKNIVAKP